MIAACSWKLGKNVGDSEVVENNELYGKTKDYNQYDKDTKVVDDNQYYDDDSLISLCVYQVFV